MIIRTYHIDAPHGMRPYLDAGADVKDLIISSVQTEVGFETNERKKKILLSVIQMIKDGVLKIILNEEKTIYTVEL